MKLVVTLCAAALVWSAAASGSLQAPKAPPKPSGLHAFVYRSDEAIKADHTYALMPAFSWNAVQGATAYNLELATSSTFSDATTLYRQSYLAPVASIQLQVPWMTGKPYALWVHVRVVSHGRTSAWSSPFGFNTAWQELPQQEPAAPGLIRWSTVEGATAYEIWFQNVPGNYQDHFTTLTNVADEREYWTFHAASAGVIRWRVRAVRLVTSASLPNGIGVVRNGPYSPVYTTTTSAALSRTRIQAVAASSDVDSLPDQPRAHQLTPGMAWQGSIDVLGDIAGVPLWRVYVFTDKQCVNPVMTGSIVGSPAWAPRTGAPLAMPGTVKDLLAFEAGKFSGFGAQGGAFAADAAPVSPAEAGVDNTTAANGGSSGVIDKAPTSLSLPDNGWPQGRYWWTVVPVGILRVTADPTKGPSDADKLEYHDMALPQDLCAAGQVWPFGVQSSPVTTTSTTPYASGLVNDMRVVSAARSTPSFQELPLITWRPALAADSYDIELSHHLYPWVAVRKQTSVVTSTVLPLTAHDIGVWYYRVRGVNPNLPGTGKNLSWSKPVAIRISGHRFIRLK